MVTRAAILIGIDKTGGLPILKAPAQDAERMEQWLKREGFQTKLITDTKNGNRAAGVVSAANIKDIVNAYVDLGTIEQLIIYFSGHGYNNFGTEIWLLSGAPVDTSEAINLFASADPAKDCSIQNIVFISDACRSNPTNPAARRVTGQNIFPNFAAGIRKRAKVDTFLATVPNAAAYEIDENIDDIIRRNSIFTTELIAAHDPPKTASAEKELVGNVAVDGVDERVVLSAKLATYLEERVPIVIAEKTGMRQQPECNVTSGVDTFIGLAHFDATQDEPPAGVLFKLGLPYSPALTPKGPLAPTLRNVATANIRLEQLGPELTQIAQESGYDAAREAVESSGNIDWHFETKTGILVSGANVVSAHSSVFFAELKRQPETPFHEIILRQGAEAGSVILQFDRGTGTAIAGLKGYIATVTVVEGRVQNVSYIPSSNSLRWQELGRNSLKRLQALRSEVATAVKYGVFKLREYEASGFADKIRMLKGIDPTLGLYAAYAYRDADMQQEILSVQEYMRSDIGCDLFDVALLSDTLNSNFPTFPFCPMLMRGWSLLLTNQVQLSAAVRRAFEHLVPALWTTFTDEGLNILKSALSRGELR